MMSLWRLDNHGTANGKSSSLSCSPQGGQCTCPTFLNMFTREMESLMGALLIVLNPAAHKPTPGPSLGGLLLQDTLISLPGWLATGRVRPIGGACLDGESQSISFIPQSQTLSVAVVLSCLLTLDPACLGFTRQNPSALGVASCCDL